VADPGHATTGGSTTVVVVVGVVATVVRLTFGVVHTRTGLSIGVTLELSGPAIEKFQYGRFFDEELGRVAFSFVQ